MSPDTVSVSELTGGLDVARRLAGLPAIAGPALPIGRRSGRIARVCIIGCCWVTVAVAPRNAARRYGTEC
jgi:hypothetical protein